MKSLRFFLIILVFIFSFHVCFGQNLTEIVEEENWLRKYGIYSYPTMVFRYDRYSKEDIENFRGKLDSFKNNEFNEGWSGVYFTGSEETVNHSELRINLNNEFTQFNIYTCFPELRYINYGKTLQTADFIQFAPEFAPNSPRKAEITKYIKVVWDKKYLLVEESALPLFAEKAAGIYVDPEDDSSADRLTWTDFWVKGDLNSENHNQVENEYKGLPEFPQSYKKFQRSAIEAKIVFVGKRIVKKADVTGNANGEFTEASYKVIINAGKDKGVKIGMTFEFPEISENFIITQVNQDSASGEIVRSVDESKNDFCIDENSNQIACPKIKPSLKAKTRIGYFWF